MSPYAHNFTGRPLPGKIKRHHVQLRRAWVPVDQQVRKRPKNVPEHDPDTRSIE